MANRLHSISLGAKLRHFRGRGRAMNRVTALAATRTSFSRTLSPPQPCLGRVLVHLVHLGRLDHGPASTRNRILLVCAGPGQAATPALG